jgi:cysteine sulfinate desulfinase/cysteine desulfurase-like protein
MDENTKPEEKQEEIQGEGRMTLGWKVTDEEIDRVIKKLEEGWQF